MNKTESVNNMKEYLFEIHSHSSQTSRCSDISAEDIVKRYKALGYDGVVITDHMNPDTFRNLENEPWEKKAEHFLSGYRAAKALEDENFSVLLGMEIRFCENNNDYLVYGFNEDFICNNPRLNEIENLKAFRPIADKNDLLVIQAHPFRQGMTIMDYKLLDGIEVYNGHPGHNSSNDIALAWAKKYSFKIMTSGSDFHGIHSEHPGGLFLEERPACPRCLIRLLRENRYRLRTDTVTE